MNELLNGFFDSICVYMQPRPEAWGTWHLCFLLIGLAISVTVAILLRRCSLRCFNNVLRCVGFFLIAIEIMKLLYNYYSLCDDFSAVVYLFPFQLCSMPIYMAVIASYLKEGNPLRTALLVFMMSYTFMSGLIAYVEPSGLLNPTYFSTIHSLTWHMLLVFLGLFIGLSGRVGRSIKDFRYAFYLFLACCGIAIALNYVLPLIITREGASVPNMFYIGPPRSSLVVYMDLWDRLGWIPTAILYVLSVSAAAFVFFFPFYFAYRRTDKVRQLPTEVN